MTEAGKKRLLIFIGLAVLATALVASSLSQMVLKPGLPLPSSEGGQLVISPVEEFPAIQLSISDFFRTVLAFLMVVLVLSLVFRMFKDFKWKNLITFFLSFAFVILVITGLLALLLSLLPPSLEPPVMLQIPTPEPVVTAPLGTPPSLLLWLVAIGLAAIVTTAGVLIFKLGTQSDAGPGLIELEAEKARQGLLAGSGLKDVVLRCYQQMSLALQEEQGIERESFMTTGEFERLLTAGGFPYEPIHQLTRLFEAVRYGRWQPNPNDEQNAIDCLTAIVTYSRERRQPGK